MKKTGTRSSNGRDDLRRRGAALRERYGKRNKKVDAFIRNAFSGTPEEHRRAARLMEEAGR